MKRWKKTTMILGASLIAGGLTLTCVGAAIGVQSIQLENGLTIFGGGSPMHNFNFFSPKRSTAANGSRITESYSLDSFSDLDMEIDIGEVKIKQGSEWKLEVKEVYQKYFSYKYEGGKLEVKYDLEGNNNAYYKNNNINTSFTLTIPSGVTLNEFEVASGVGNTVIQSIAASVSDISTGVGDTDIQNCSFGSLELSGGVGDTVAVGMRISGPVEVSSGIGNVSLSGDFQSNITVEGGMGDTTLNLENCKREDYNFSITGGMGDTVIDGHAYGWGSEKNETFPGATRYLTIDCGVGTVRINFNGGSSSATADVASTISDSVTSAVEGSIASAIENGIASAFPTLPKVPSVPELNGDDMLNTMGGKNWAGNGSITDNSNADKLLIDLDCEIKNFTGTYVLMAAEASKEVRREFSYDIEDTSGLVELEWVKPNGTVETLSVGSADDSKDLILPAGRNVFMMVAPEGTTVKKLEAEIGLDND